MLAQVAAATGWAPDTEWFGSDRDGHVAVFSTAGLGPVPTRATTDTEGHVAVWEALEEVGMRSGMGELDFWDLGVGPKVGAYAFDYSPVGVGYGQYSPRQPYRCVGRPEHPVTSAELSPKARTYLADVCVRDVCFADIDVVVVEDMFGSINRPTMWDAR